MIFTIIISLFKSIKMRLLEKKISIRILLILLVLFFFIIIFYSALLKSALNNKDLDNARFSKLKKISIFVSNIHNNLKPSNLKKNFENLNEEKVFKSSKQRQEGIKIHKDVKLNELIILPRFDKELNRNIVEIRRLDNFKLLHTFKPNIAEIHKLIPNDWEFKHVSKDWSKERYIFNHPEIDSFGNLIFKSESPLVKIDFCGKILWVNHVDNFHHSIELDSDGNIFSPTYIFPTSLDESLFGKTKSWEYMNINDDSITKLNQEGEIVYQKSIVQILLDNGYKGLIFGMRDLFTHDPLHINDIQPTKFNTKYWRKDDLFLSSRRLSMIIHYRPSSNKIINLIQGPFSRQHDVDIYSDKEISIFNNNEIYTIKGLLVDKNSEILVYNLETRKFRKIFNKTLKNIQFSSETNGLHEFLKDGSLLIEDGPGGRLIYLNNMGDLIWEFNNNYRITWTRVVKDLEKINKINNLINEKKCKN